MKIYFLKLLYQILFTKIDEESNLCAFLTYGSYESGRTEPKLADLLEMAAFFNVTTDQLLGGRYKITQAHCCQKWGTVIGNHRQFG